MTRETPEFKDTLRQVRLLLAANALVCLVALGFAIRTINQAGGDYRLAIGLVLLVLVTAGNITYLRKYLNKSRVLVQLEEEAQRMDTCFKEVHHRVKNNLQTVSSLLNLQQRTTEDPSAVKLIRSSQHRVKSMAIVHEMLYSHNKYTSRLDAGTYFRDLAQSLIRSFSDGERPRVALQIETHGIGLNADTLIPLGILANEVITNSLKYAFPIDRQGQIRIELRSPEPGLYTLFMGDNGIGMSDRWDENTIETGQNVRISSPASLGLTLIDKITRQLKGTLRRGSDSEGTWYELEFEESVQGHEL